MKKSVLLVTAAVIAGSAFAEDQLTPRSIEGLNVSQLRAEMKAARKAKAPAAKPAQTATAADYVTPEGEPQDYLASGYFYSLFGLSYGNYATTASASADGKTVYFNSLFPSAMADIWTPGAIDGNTVTFNCTTVVGQYYGTYDLTVGELILDEEGNITGYQDLVLAKDGDHFYIDDNWDAPEHYAALLAFIDGEFKGFLSYGLFLDYAPVTVPDPVALPEGAEPQPCTYSYKNAYGSPVAEKALGYIDGDDIYLNNLTPGLEAWVKGTIDGDKATFAGGQYLGIYGSYFIYYNPFVYEGEDADGYGIYTAAEVVFDIAEDGSLTQVDNGAYSSFSTTEDPADAYNYGYDYKVAPYLGVQFGIPADPSGLSVNDYWDSYGQFYFGYSLANIGTNGAFLEPDNFYYSLYVDDEPYAVGPDNFSYISEEMVEIPLNYADESNGYDLGPGYAWIPENLWETLGVQGIYYYEGKAYYSNIVSVDLEGNTYVTEVENGDTPTNISTIYSAAVHKNIIYNAMGRKINVAERGLNIVNGKKMFVK